MVKPGRVWLYEKGTWQGPLLYRGSDEYGRLTLALRLPGERAVVWAYRYCTDPACDCAAMSRCPTTGKLHGAFTNGRAACDDCDVDEAMPAALDW
jgi:hypothetical protein